MIIIKRQFMRCSNVARVTTRAPCHNEWCTKNCVPVAISSSLIQGNWIPASAIKPILSSPLAAWLLIEPHRRIAFGFRRIFSNKCGKWSWFCACASCYCCYMSLNCLRCLFLFFIFSFDGLVVFGSRRWSLMSKIQTSSKSPIKASVCLSVLLFCLE